jgi:hypothetical protein
MSRNTVEAVEAALAASSALQWTVVDRADEEASIVAVSAALDTVDKELVQHLRESLSASHLLNCSVWATPYGQGLVLRFAAAV